MFEEGGDEVAEEGLSVGGFAAEMAVFEVAAGHGEEGRAEGSRDHKRASSREQNSIKIVAGSFKNTDLYLTKPPCGLDRRPRLIDLGLELPMLA